MNIIIIIIIIIFILLIFYILNTRSHIQLFRKQKLDVAVIVEPRKDELLIKVIHNYLKLLPKNTKIQIFHGLNNEKFLLDNFSQEIFNNKIILTKLNRTNLTIKDYNFLLTSKDFYNRINGENILIFQMDTCLCSNTKYKIEDFLIYDYVGAPFINQEYMKYEYNNKIYKVKLDNKIGNGGLSLRKKSKILQYLNESKYNGEPEDIYFSLNKKFKFPSIETASNFSTENLFNPYSYGVHQGHKTLSKNNIKILSQTCPEFKIFLNKN